MYNNKNSKLLVLNITVTLFWCVMVTNFATLLYTVIGIRAFINLGSYVGNIGNDWDKKERKLCNYAVILISM